MPPPSAVVKGHSGQVVLPSAEAQSELSDFGSNTPDPPTQDSAYLVVSPSVARAVNGETEQGCQVVGPSAESMQLPSAEQADIELVQASSDACQVVMPSAGSDIRHSLAGSSLVVIPSADASGPAEPGCHLQIESSQVVVPSAEASDPVVPQEVPPVVRPLDHGSEIESGLFGANGQSTTARPPGAPERLGDNSRACVTGSPCQVVAPSAVEQDARQAAAPAAVHTAKNSQHEACQVVFPSAALSIGKAGEAAGAPVTGPVSHPTLGSTDCVTNVGVLDIKRRKRSPNRRGGAPGRLAMAVPQAAPKRATADFAMRTAELALPSLRTCRVTVPPASMGLRCRRSSKQAATFRKSRSCRRN